MKKVYIYMTAGACPRRRVETSNFTRIFQENGYALTDSLKDADLVLVNTCSYNKIRDAVSLRIIKEFKKYNKKLIVSGCLPAINHSGLKDLFDGPSFSVKENEKLRSILEEDSGSKNYKEAPVVSYEYTNPKLPFSLLFQLAFSADFIKEWILMVEQVFLRLLPKYSFSNNIVTLVPCEGCMGNCSFCAIKGAIGKIKSRSKESIVSDIRQFVKNNVRDIRIMAADLGGYGIDINSSLIELLDDIVRIDGDFKLSLGEMNPNWIIRNENELYRLLDYNRISRLTIPVQSGSEKVLRMMNRPIDLNRLSDILLNIKKRYPTMRMTSHMIVGFPGEGEDDLDKSIAFFNKIGFYETWIMNYIEKDTAESSRFPEKVSHSDIKKRARKAYASLSRNKEIRILYPAGLFFRGLFPRLKQYFYWKSVKNEREND